MNFLCWIDAVRRRWKRNWLGSQEGKWDCSSLMAAARKLRRSRHKQVLMDWMRERKRPLAPHPEGTMLPSCEKASRSMLP